MICNNLNGITRACLPNINGLKAFYINDLENIDQDSITIVDGEVTAMSLEASPAYGFKKYEFRKMNGTNYVEGTNNPQAGLDGYVPTLTLMINGRNAAASQEIQNLTVGGRELVVIVSDNNNINWVYFIRNGGSVSAETGGSEDGLYTVTITGQEPEKAPTISTAILLTLLA